MPKRFHLDFKKVFDEYMSANQKVWSHDRSTTVGASEVFGCLRSVFFDKRGEELGYKPDSGFTDRWGAKERGNLIENYFVVPAVSHHLPKPLVLQFQGVGQETIVFERSSATTDGLITGFPKNCKLTVSYGNHVVDIDNIKGDCINFEIKSIDPNASLEEEKSIHRGQSITQMGLIREKTKWKPEYSIILYVNASWLDDIKPFVVPFSDRVYKTSRKRAESVWESNDPNDFIPEGKMSDRCKFCRWQAACGEAILRGIPDGDGEVPSQLRDGLDEMLAARAKWKSIFDEAKEEYEAAGEQIKGILKDAEVRKTTAGDNNQWALNWYPVKGKTRLNKDRMEADGIDVSKYEERGNPYEVLRVTPVKEKL